MSFPLPAFNVSPNSNRMTDFIYDFAGNLINDGAHSYTYDEAGNLIYVHGGHMAWDDCDALNRRIMHVKGGYSSYKRCEYNIDGRLAGVWQDEDLTQRLQR